MPLSLPRRLAPSVLLSAVAASAALALTATPALAAAPEEPITQPATLTTATTATLNGELNPNANGTAAFQFSYNTNGTCTEGTTTPLGAEKEGQAIKVQTPVTGLIPGTEYTFCVIASHLEGETTEATAGAPQTFTTPTAPPAIDSESVSALKATEATLEAQINPNNQQTTYVFEYAIEESMLGTLGATKLSGAEPLSGFGDQLASVATGPALLPGATYSYRAIATNAAAEETIGPIEHFTTPIPPQTPHTTSPPTAITSESATLEGVLNPTAAGNPGTYEFLYRESATECQGSKATPAEAMTGAEGQAVSAPVSELLPGATYSFCLLARNEAGETALGNTVTFTTTGVKPTIVPESDADRNLTETAVDLTAQVNPNGSQLSSCTFAYGTSTSSETAVPCDQSLTQIGSGRSPTTVSAHVTGLEAATKTYHWHLIVANAAGSETTVDHTFIDEAAAPLPDGRQYEMVTPALKNDALVGAALGSESAWPPRIAENGQDLVAPNVQCFASPESCTADRQKVGSAYEFARTPSGWVTHPLVPPINAFQSSSLWAADPETHQTLFSAATPPSGGDDFYTRHADGTLSDIGPLGEGSEGTGGGPNYGPVKLKRVVATTGFSHLLYQGNELWSLDGAPENEVSLYEYSGTGNHQPMLVGVSGGQGATSLISGCGTHLGGGGHGGVGGTDQYGSLSGTGRTAYFTATCGVKTSDELYARVDGERADAHTVAISAPVASGCVSVECQTAPAAEGIFAGASTNGSRVFFTSTGQYTDNASQGTGPAGVQCNIAGAAGCNLYESVCAEPCGTPEEEPNAKERELVDVSEGAKATGGPRVQGVMAISPDGSHVYFVARGVLTSQENQNHEKAVDGAENLYVHTEGQPPKFIATLPPADAEEFKLEKGFEYPQGIELANVTPEGRFLVFLSHGALTPDDTRPAVEGATAPPAQVYRYDDQTGELIRISVGRHGFNDNGNAGIADAGIAIAQTGFQLGIGPAHPDPTMSHNGEYVFFESPVALAPGALNDVEIPFFPGKSGFAENVYEYHNGTVSLISDGKDTSPQSVTPGLSTPVRLLGTDESGANVFFATNDQLTAQDTDTQRDYYDARICTTSEPCYTPPTPATPCSEEGCRGAAPGAPASQTPGSQSFAGPGNLAPPPPAPAVKPKPLTRAQKLSRALKACRSKHNKHKRTVCEKQARKRFGKAAKKAKKSTNHKRRTR